MIDIPAVRHSAGVSLMGGVLIIVALFILFTGTLAGAQSAGAGDQVPASYYGEITINGEPAPSGTTITAVINGEERGELVTSEEGKYGGPTGSDEKLVVYGSEEDRGATVQFHVDAPGFEDGAAEETIEWTPGDVTKLPLTVNLSREGVDTPTGTPVSPGDGTPTATPAPDSTPTPEPTPTSEDTPDPTPTPISTPDETPGPTPTETPRPIQTPGETPDDIPPPSGDTSEDSQWVDPREIPDIEIVDVELTAEAANSIDVTGVVTLENQADVEQEVQVRFVLNGDVIAEESVKVPHNERVQVRNTERVSDQGEYLFSSNLAIETEEGELVRTFDFELGRIQLDETGEYIVQETEGIQPVTDKLELPFDERPEPDSDDGYPSWLLGMGILSLVIAFSWLIIWWRSDNDS